MALENPFRFSPKRASDATDWVLYERRTYSPALGRWLSKDPIEEQGGANLYVFAVNSPLIKTDLFGLSSSTGGELIAKYTARASLALLVPFIGIPFNINNRHYAFEGDQTVKTDTYHARNQFYFKKAEQQRVSGGWTKVNATDHDADKLAPFRVTTGVTGFALSEPHFVSAEGSFEACRGVGRALSIRNVKVRWHWYDEMDANSWKEGEGKGNDMRLIEAIANGISDTILRAHFNFEVLFDDVEGDRKIVGIL
jgi:RHS repeat-associated protein